MQSESVEQLGAGGAYALEELHGRGQLLHGIRGRIGMGHTGILADGESWGEWVHEASSFSRRGNMLELLWQAGAIISARTSGRTP